MKLNAKEKKQLLILILSCIWLYIIPIVYQFLFISKDNPQKVVKLIEADIAKKEKQFSKLAANEFLINQLFNNRYSEKELKEVAGYKYSFHLYQVFKDSTYQLRFWNNSKLTPKKEELFWPDGFYTQTKNNGIHRFAKKTFTSGEGSVVLTAYLPVYWEYFIETDYLQKFFDASKEIIKKYEVKNTPTIYPVKDSKGETVLYIQKTNDQRNTGFSWIHILCRVASFLMLIYILFWLCSRTVSLIDFHKSFLILAGALILLRFITIWQPFPFQYKAIEYFDPRIYATNSLFKSLGDLTMNLIFIFVALVFWNKFYQPTKAKWNYTVLNFSIKDAIKCILFVVVSYYTIWLFRSLINSSSISFNVINFFSLNIYTLLGFAHLSLIAFLYHYISFGVLKIDRTFRHNILISSGLIIVAGLVILFSNVYWANELICVVFLIWMFGYVIIRTFIIKEIPTNWWQIPLAWLLFFSFSTAILFNYENKRKELGDRKWLAQKLALQSDPNTESLLGIALSKFDNHYLNKNFASFSDPELSINYKKKILNENFIGYLNKFQTTIHTYDSLERPLFNTDSLSYAYFNAIIENQASPIYGMNDLYFFEIGFEQFTYLFKKQITDTSGKKLGYFIVQSKPINFKNKSAALSPELFKQRKSRIDDNGNNYIYAIYKNFQLQKRFFDYDLPTQITKEDIPATEYYLTNQQGYEELWWKLNVNSVVVVGKKKNNLLEVITLFAYMFLSFIILLFFVRMYFSLSNRKAFENMKEQIRRLTFAKQVQGLVWIVSLLTFIIVSYVIIAQFKSRFDKANLERLSRTMSILLADVQNKINSNAVFDDVVKIYEPVANESLKETIFQMSEIHNVDFNIYDLGGTLKLSSQPFIESKGISSERIDPTAYFNLKKKNSAQYVQEEFIGNFKYLSMYVPILDNNGRTYGYLNIPYYSSQSDLNQEISNFIITIIYLMAFIFLIAGIIAWLFTNRITSSFNLIGSKMQEISFGKNELIEWKGNDEIGNLVKEYNKMVMKLEGSAKELAKTEREGAWREMARQVAHEIKNPLTPMKLSIQYLQKNINDGNPNISQLTQNVSKTLVEQIDHLSNIASDFSQFANIGIPQNEKIDLIEIIDSLIKLFSSESGANLIFLKDFDKAFILADKTQINRLFTNLIKNAIQAYNDVAFKFVTIRIVKEAHNYIISVEDRAGGIPSDIQQKIFIPNFTTKTSGTGLGLAISKGIVENAGGEISFRSIENFGTTFYVRFVAFEEAGNIEKATT